MPAQNAFVLQVRGTPEYDAFLDRLAKATGEPDRSKLAERALAELAHQVGLRTPPRVTPAGWSRRRKAAEDVAHVRTYPAEGQPPAVGG
jgi:hypothetical protein